MNGERYDILAGNIERMNQDISQIRGAAAKMQRLLEDLLELSRIGRLMNAPEYASLTDLAHEAATRTARTPCTARIACTIRPPCTARTACTIRTPCTAPIARVAARDEGREGEHQPRQDTHREDRAASAVTHG